MHCWYRPIPIKSNSRLMSMALRSYNLYQTKRERASIGGELAIADALPRSLHSRQLGA